VVFFLGSNLIPTGGKHSPATKERGCSIEYIENSINFGFAKLTFR